MLNVRQVILETLSQRGSLGIEEIARVTRLSKMAARYHLGLLERAGLVLACRVVESSRSVGRPKLRYKLSERAHELLPKRYDAFAALLLDQVQRTLGSKRVCELLRRVGRRVAAAAPQDRGAGTGPRLRRLVRFLSPRGYRASWERTSDGYELVVHDCPYRQIAQAQPCVCEMDRALIGALLGAPFTMTTCIARRDPECHFVIEN